MALACSIAPSHRRRICGGISLSVLVFGLLFAATVFGFPRWVTSYRYDNSNAVSDLFPVAVIRDGTPGIVQWSAYQKSSEQFAPQLMRSPTTVRQMLGNHEYLQLTEKPARTFELKWQTDDYVYWARYAIEDGRVRPISFRYSGPFVVGWAVLVGLAGVMLLSIWRGWNARGDSRR